MNKEIQDNVENNSLQIEDIVNAIVAKYTEAGSSYEAISTFWEEYPNATNVELDGGGVNNNYGEIKS